MSSKSGMNCDQHAGTWGTLLLRACIKVSTRDQVHHRLERQELVGEHEVYDACRTKT